MRRLIFKNRWFLFPFLLLWLATGYFQLIYSQTQLSIFINQLWHPIYDVLFKYTTHMGDGLFSGLFTLIMLPFSLRKALLIFLSYCLSGIIVLFFKCILMPRTPRPAIVMEDLLPTLHTISDVKLHSYASFPSGHTTSAFALFAMLAMFSPNCFTRFICLVIAIVVALSRVYLLQHFMIDIYVGSVLGILSSFFIFHQLENHWQCNPRNWHQRGLVINKNA